MSRLVDISPYEKCRIVLHKDDSGFPVKDLPTVDAVEVVRCKDCQFWDNEHISSEGLAKCVTGESGIRYRRSYDFCSYGELKEVSE